MNIDIHICKHVLIQYFRLQKFGCIADGSMLMNLHLQKTLAKHNFNLAVTVFTRFCAPFEMVLCIYGQREKMVPAQNDPLYLPLNTNMLICIPLSFVKLSIGPYNDCGVFELE